MNTFCDCVFVRFFVYMLFRCYEDVGVKIWRVKSHTSLSTPAQQRGVQTNTHTRAHTHTHKHTYTHLKQGIGI